jgi:DNA repair protein RecO (recombination protein O)
MPLVHDGCICLRKVEYSETSQILTLLSRDHGLLRAIAKGAHRTTKAGASKFGGGIDLLDLADAVFTHAPEKELATLCEWTLRDGHLALRRNLRATYLALYAAELVATLIEEHDPHPDLFDRLQQTLAELETDRVEEAFVVFQLDLLRETGYLPQIECCAACGTRVDESARAFFSPASSGAVCRNCEGATPDRIEVDPRILRLAQGLLRLPRFNGAPQRLPRLTRHQSDPLNRILAEHVEHTLSKRLRMRGYILRQSDSAS